MPRAIYCRGDNGTPAHISDGKAGGVIEIPVPNFDRPDQRAGSKHRSLVVCFGRAAPKKLFVPGIAAPLGSL